MNFGKPKNLSEMDFIDLDDNWALGKKDFSFRINGYSNHRHVSVPDKERFFDCPLLLKSVPWLHEYLKFRTFQLKQSSSWTNKTDNEKRSYTGLFLPFHACKKFCPILNLLRHSCVKK